MKIEISVNGTTIVGWKNVQVTRSLRAIAASFEAEVHDVWMGRSQKVFSLRGAPCEVRASELRRTLLVGFIEEASLSLSSTAHTVRVGGRTRTGDLVDCSVRPGVSEFLGQRLEDIARALCEPFGIGVRTLCDTGEPLRSFRIQPGETVFEALERAARLRGVFLSCDVGGALEIRREPATPALGGEARLVFGEGIRALDVETSEERFAEYVVVGAAGNSRDGSWETGSPIVERATDESCRRRGRVLVLHDASVTSASAATARARWEAARRVGAALQARVQVRGWTDGTGELWTPGRRVRLVVPAESLDEGLVVESVRLSLSDAGTLADLVLVHPSSLALEPVTEPKRKGGEVWQ